MSPPGGGRHEVSARLLRHFNIIFIASLSEEVLTRIFQTLIEDHLRRQQIGGLCYNILRSAVPATVNVLLFVQAKLKPTPAKSHYIFSMREVDRTIQGMMRLKKDQVNNDDKKVIRLWIHEIGRVFSDRLAD